LRSGFRAVALETPWATARIATRYVESCTGSPQEAARSIFGVFAFVQMRGLFEWMCKWNTAHPADKVAFWGYDIQDPWSDGALLRELVARAAPEQAKVTHDLEACIGVKYSSAAEALATPLRKG
jgi:erythromycin esterase-like protein